MNAAKSYAAKIAAARALLAQLAADIDAHEKAAAAKPGDWGFVGDMGALVEQLQNAHDFIK